MSDVQCCLLLEKNGKLQNSLTADKTSDDILGCTGHVDFDLQISQHCYLDSLRLRVSVRTQERYWI